jgi:ADP-ribose pyrophosphatase YjhB (NUDIX family)
MSVPPTIGHVTRMEYYHDVVAPEARKVLPAAFAIVRNGYGLGQVLLVRHADDGFWELPGGRVEVGESASAAVVREVAEEAGVAIKVTGLAGVYSDPGHVQAYPHGDGIYQRLAVCFHAVTPDTDASPIRTRPAPRRGSTPSTQCSGSCTQRSVNALPTH